MTTYADTTNLTEILKNVYGEGITNQFNDEKITYNLFSKSDRKPGGKGYVFALRYARAQGTGARGESSKLPDPLTGKKDQEEKKLRETEYPDQTIARLEKQLKEKEAADRHKEENQKQQEAAKQALKNYDREVQSLVKEMELPKEQQAFAMEFMGVNNPFNEIDITDRKAINRMVADQKKKLESFKQSVIQDYIKGKETIPKVGATTAAPMGDKTKVYLKDARKALHEAMNRVTGG